MNNLTLAIADESRNARFKTYLKGKALKYLPFHVIESLFFLVSMFITSGFGYRFMLSVFYLIFSVSGLIVARRHLWTVSYFAIFLTEIPIICNIAIWFLIDEDSFTIDNDFGIVRLCVVITFETIVF